MPENGYRDLGPVARRDEIGDIVTDIYGNRFIVEQVGMRYLSVKPEAGGKVLLVKVSDRIQTFEKVKINDTN